MTFGLCPNCENKVDVGDKPEFGAHRHCQTCRNDLVIIWLNPIELAMIADEDYGRLDDYSSENIFQRIKKKENIEAAGKPNNSNKKPSNTTGKKKTRK